LVRRIYYPELLRGCSCHGVTPFATRRELPESRKRVAPLSVSESDAQRSALINHERFLSAGVCTVFVQQVPEYSHLFGLTPRPSPISRVISPFLQHLVAMDTEQILPPAPKYVRFRVLIIGRANAGKTSILQRVCDTTESPEIHSVGPSGDHNPVRPRS